MLPNEWSLVLTWMFAISKVSGQIGTGLKEDYNQLEAPENPTGDPLNINCVILSLDVIDVDVEKHAVKLSVSFMLNWQENRLEDSSSGIDSKSKMVGKLLEALLIIGTYLRFLTKI